MPTTKLKELLETHQVPHTVVPHPRAFTALEVAEAAHIPGREMAKTVVVKLDGRPALAVLPAPFKVDLERLRRSTGAARAELADEGDFADEFPDCERGAMPPFGELYGLPVFVEPHLAADARIAFNAGTHTEVVYMDYQDFARLAHPRLVDM